MFFNAFDLDSQGSFYLKNDINISAILKGPMIIWYTAHPYTIFFPKTRQSMMYLKAMIEHGLKQSDGLSGGFVG